MTISKQLYVNNAKTTLSVLATPTDTVITVADGSRFPTPGVGEYFLVTLEAGALIEVVKVTGRTGNTFTGCERGYEGSAGHFPAGARIECRATAKTFESFARKQDRVADIGSVDLLSPPAESDSNSYICHSNDDGNNPIIAFKDDEDTWKFTTHRHVVLNGATSSATTTSVTSTNIAKLVTSVVSGKYIIQFFTGANAGLSRLISSSSTNQVSWLTALPSTPATGDQFQIYKSDISIINELLAASDDGLIYSILLSE